MHLYKIKIKHENETVSYAYVACERIQDIESLIGEKIKDSFTIKEITEVCEEENFFFQLPHDF